MKVEAKLNGMHVRQPCVACGMWDRPRDVAFFVDDDWVCDACVEGGVEHIRAGLRGQADRYRRIADTLENDAAGDIEILPISPEVRAVLNRLEREREQWERQARKERMAGRGWSDDDLLFDDLYF